MSVEGQGGNPEAVFWRTEDRRMGVACSQCSFVSFTEHQDTGEAWRMATDHLKFDHGLRRVWIENVDRSTTAVVQLAFTLALDAQARATERATTGRN
jgi:hypothetical protein